MIIDKKLKRIDKLNKRIMVWYITRFKYHIDARYCGEDVITELPAKMKVFYDSKRTPLSVKFIASISSNDGKCMIFNEAILIREPKFFPFGKFEPVMVSAIYDHATKKADLVFNLIL